MSEQAHEHIVVAAPPQRCFDVTTAFERYPQWARDVKQIDVLGRDEEGRGKTVEFRVAGLGRSIHYVLEYDYTEAPAAFSWHLLEGDVLRRLDGRYGFETEGDGTPRDLRPGRGDRYPDAGSHQAPGGRNDHGHRVARAQERGGVMTEATASHEPEAVTGADPAAAPDPEPDDADLDDADLDYSDPTGRGRHRRHRPPSNRS